MDRIDQLKGAGNYRAWKIRILNLLRANDLYEDLTLVEPDDDLNYNKADRKAKAILSNNIQDSIIQDVDWEKSTMEILDELEKKFVNSNVFSKSLMIENILNNLKLNSKMDLEEFLNTFEKTCNELNGTTEEINNDKRIRKVLNLLPSEYNPVVASVNALTPNQRTFNYVANLIRQYKNTLDKEQERPKVLIASARNKPDKPTKKVNEGSNKRGTFRRGRGANRGATRGRRVATNGRTKKPNCNWCFKTGHEESQCFTKKKT